MNKLKLIILAAFAVFYCLSNPGSAEQAHKVKPAGVLKTIISLSPAVTEELYLLGADKMLIADTIYCRRPDGARKKKKIGDLINFNVEMVIELNPDLVICTTLVNKNKLGRLKDVGINTVVLNPPKNFNEICSNFLKLGRETGRYNQAEQLVGKALSDVESIKRAADNCPVKRVFIQIGTKPLVTVNKDYFINDYITLCNGINISAEAKSILYSREDVVLSDPDIIIITGMGMTAVDEKKIWNKYSGLKAVKNKNIFIVDSDIFCNPTLTTFIEALKISVSILHPEIKNRNY